MTGPMFTAYVNSYNHEKYVETSLRSLLDQTVAVDRILFSSDGSTDRTLEIARDMFANDSRVEYLPDLHTNRGLIARMIEIHDRVAEGYLIPLSGDDAWNVHRVEVHRRDILRTATEWSIGATAVCDGELRETRRWDPVETRRTHQGAIYDIILSAWPAFPMLGWAYSASLYRRSGGLSPKRLFEDYPLALAFARVCDPVLTSDLVSYYRVLDESFARAPSRQVELFEEAAWIALDEIRYRPLLAANTASRSFLQSAAHAFRNGRHVDALRCWLYGYACWPTPHRLGQVLYSALRATAVVAIKGTRGHDGRH